MAFARPDGRVEDMGVLEASRRRGAGDWSLGAWPPTQTCFPQSPMANAVRLRRWGRTQKILKRG